MIRVIAVALTLCVALVVGCSGDDSEVELTGEITISPNPLNLLSARVAATTGEAVSVTVVAESDDGHRVEMPAGPSATDHELPLLGLRPERSYEIELFDSDRSLGAVELETPELPDGFAEITLGGSSSDRSASGLTLMNIIPFPLEPPEEPTATDAGFIVMVDSAGEVVWYHGPLDHPVIGVELTPDNTVMFSYNHMTLREIDLMGNLLGEWAGTAATDKLVEDEFGRPYFSEEAVPVPVDSLHHEIEFLDDGSVLTLSSTLEEIVSESQLCVDAIDDGDGVYPVVSDSIVVLDRSTATIGTDISLFDVLDPNGDPEASRVCGQPPTVTQVPNFMYPEVPGGGPYDWTHANAVVLDEANNQYIVSVRHYDSLIAVRASDDADGPAGELLWTMGEGGDFELESGEWWSYQHSPEIQDDGTILLYDNGNRRPSAPGEVEPGMLEEGEEFVPDPDNPPYSRAVRVEYDTESGTVNQIWEHRFDVGGEPVYAGIVGDADRLDNGNILITHGISTTGSYVIEVTPDELEGGEVVWQLSLPPGYVIYRAERIPELSEIVAAVS